MSISKYINWTYPRLFFILRNDLLHSLPIFITCAWIKNKSTLLCIIQWTIWKWRNIYFDRKFNYWLLINTKLIISDMYIKLNNLALLLLINGGSIFNYQYDFDIYFQIINYRTFCSKSLISYSLQDSSTFKTARQTQHFLL